MRQNFLYRLDRLFRGKVESAAKVVAARSCRPRPGRPALPQGCWPNRDPPNLLIFQYNQLDKRNKVKQNLTLAAAPARLMGAGTSGPGSSGFRINGRLWLEEDGETKRLGIARALVIEPEVFCLDEPTANLDPKNAEIIEQIIFSMKTAGKSTIIVVTHDPAQARRLGDQPLVMDNGRIAPL